MSSIKTYLRKLKYNLTYQFKSNLELPSDFRLFNRRDTSYQQFIYKHCRPDKNTNLDLGRSLKIFGKISDEYVINSDIFTNFNFSNKKLKPAYFNSADVKVPYEASRLQYLQKANSGIIDVNNFPSIYWNSPMDVAIRNVNLIFHLLSIENNYQTAEILGNNKDLLTSYISQHYEFITDNLENTGNVVGNHYLIELTSILLTIATFKFNGDQDEWKFYINELTSELNNQFYEDGTNFEGSTHYAAFVTEALIVCKLAIQEIDNNSLVLKKIDEIIKLKINGACFIKTDVPAKIIRKGIMKAGGRYWCSEDHIHARKKADPKPVLLRGGGYMDYGYGICTENGWLTRSLDEI